MKTPIINIMRRPRWLNRSIQTWLLYAILCVLGLCQFGCAYAQLKGASINDQPVRKVESLGIEVIREGEQITPKLGLALEKGDEIKTPPGVTALINFNNRAEVIMMPETHITIESIFVWFGKVITTIKGEFKTKTKLVTGSHGGTVFILTVDRNDQSTISMIEGGIDLKSNTDRWSVFLKSGQEASISSEEREIVTIPRERYNNLVQFINKTKQSVGRTKIKMIVPKIIGLQQYDAQRILSSAGLQIGKVSKTIDVYDVDEEYAIGDVVRQQPEFGKEIKSGGSVDIWILARAVVIPHVIGQHRNEAIRIIQEAGLSVHPDIQEKITGQYEPGVVNDQSPNAGQRVVEGTAVRLTVEAVSTKVPNVTEMPVRQGESLIREIGLTIRTMTSRLDPDIEIPRIVGQDPAAGNLVRPGTTVTLHVANPGIRVPDLIREYEREATSLLGEANLRKGYVSKTSSSQYPTGMVMNQSPSAGQVVEPGSAVNLTISTGVPAQQPTRPSFELVPLESSHPNITVTRVTFDQRSSLVTYWLKAEGRLPQNFNMAIQVQYGKRSQWLTRWRLSQNLFDQLNKGLTITESRKIDKPYWGDGEYIISIFADIDNQISETNENDNRSDTKIRTIG